MVQRAQHQLASAWVYAAAYVCVYAGVVRVLVRMYVYVFGVIAHMLQRAQHQLAASAGMCLCIVMNITNILLS